MPKDSATRAGHGNVEHPNGEPEFHAGKWYCPGCRRTFSDAPPNKGYLDFDGKLGACRQSCYDLIFGRREETSYREWLDWLSGKAQTAVAA